MPFEHRLYSYPWTLTAALLAAVAGCHGDDHGTRTPASVAASLAPVIELEQLPVGIVVSGSGRLFLSFSRAIDENEPFSLAEVKNGKTELYPPGLAQELGAPAPDRLLSVQALTVDAADRLWIIDTAKVGQNPIVPGTAKLVGVDLASDRVVATFFFPPEVAGASALVNDVRVDLRRGAGGMAFFTDSSTDGPNGLIVLDLATGQSWRRLNDHPSTKPDPGFVGRSEGQPLIVRKGPKSGQPYRAGSDGIALDADGHHLWYSPLSSRHLYRVDADRLADPNAGEAEVAATVEDLGDRGFASDGLLGDEEGRLYLTDYENQAIHRRSADGTIDVVASDDRLLWPDSMTLGSDGTLYFTATQIERSSLLRGGDERLRPFTVWRIDTDSRPLALAPSK
jgi:sugar lactone lactonase YvrE